MAASSRELPPEMESDDEEHGDGEECQATHAAEKNEEEKENSFDFLKLRNDAGLDFYDTLRLINFIRTKVIAASSFQTYRFGSIVD